MKVVPFNPDTLKEAVSLLKSGGVIAHPADTCFGLTADVMNPKAYKKIQDIKGRDYKKPMSIMISVAQQLQINNFVVLDDFSSFVTFKLFPGAVTVVLPKGPAIPDYYFPELTTVGLRVPMHNMTQDLLTAFRGPLITTSANQSGKCLAFNHKEVVESFKNSKFSPDLVFEGKCTNHTEASTVIMPKKDFIQIMRKGPITASQLEGILGVHVKE